MNAHRKTSIYRRRRAVAALLVVTVVIAVAALVDWIGEGLAAVRRPPYSTPLVRVSHHVHVVRPGETLWSIARTIQPRGDVRPVLDRMAEARGGAPLRAGERVVLP